MPSRILGEVYGKTPLSLSRPFTIKDKRPCPFRTELHSAFHKGGGKKPWDCDCHKKNRVCSVFQGPVGPTTPGQRRTDGLIATCPSRFLQANVIRDIARIAWGKPDGADFAVASEVSIGGKWQVDMALYETDAAGDVSDFCSVEIQAIDITNSIGSHVEAFSQNQATAPSLKDPGFNWANATIKRLFTQLLFKGYMHHVWGRKIAVVLQDRTLDYIRNTVTLATVPDMSEADICILPYSYTAPAGDPSSYRLTLAEDRVLKVPYGSFALSTLSVELPDISKHQSSFFDRTL